MDIEITESHPVRDWFWSVFVRAPQAVMDLDRFSLAKQFVHVGDARVAYRDDGAGPHREAYDNWPSADERHFITATQLPGIGRLALWAWSHPAWADRLAADIPGVQRVEILDPGHLLMEDDPDLVAEILTEFLAHTRTPAPAGTGGRS